jgi:hypothetical protein
MLTLLPYSVRALSHLLSTHGGPLPGLEQSALKYRSTVSAALQRIYDVWPALAAKIGSVVRYVMLFDDRTRNSFAMIGAHGVLFLNVAHGSSEAFFVEDIAHQAGHVLFTAAWHGSEPLLTVSPDMRIQQATAHDDHRSFEVALHGMVTQTLMVSALDKFLASKPEADRPEATGRLVFALLRLGFDLRLLANLPVYTDRGMALVRAMIAAYSSAAERYGEVMLATNFAGQPYNFDYEVYRAQNAAVGTRY